jgi:hypothetical protein
MDMYVYLGWAQWEADWAFKGTSMVATSNFSLLKRVVDKAKVGPLTALQPLVWSHSSALTIQASTHSWRGARMMQEQPWVTRTNAGVQGLATAAMLLLGAALAYGFRHFERGVWSGMLAGFLLGLLLLLVGIANLVMGGSQCITVDPRRRCITVTGTSRWSRSCRRIGFDEIADVSVGELGDREGGSVSYHVVLRLKSSKTIPLFVAFFDGQWDQRVAEQRCQRLRQMVQSAS